MPRPKPNLELRSMSRADIAALEDPTDLYDCITEGTWAGMPNYGCPCCPHAMVGDREDIVEHLRKVHIAPIMEERAMRQPGVGLFDADGRMITEESIVGAGAGAEEITVEEQNAEN